MKQVYENNKDLANSFYNGQTTDVQDEQLYNAILDDGDYNPEYLEDFDLALQDFWSWMDSNAS